MQAVFQPIKLQIYYRVIFIIWVKLRKLRGKSHIEFRTQCVIMTLAGSNRRERLSLMVLWNSQKLSNLKVHVLNLLLLDLFNHPWKKVTNQLREQLKLYEINQRLKLRPCIPIVLLEPICTGELSELFNLL